MSLSKQGKGALPIFQAAQYFPPVLEKLSNEFHDGKNKKFVAKESNGGGYGWIGCHGYGTSRMSLPLTYLGLLLLGFSGHGKIFKAFCKDRRCC